MKYSLKNNFSFSVVLLFICVLLLSSCGTSKPKVITSKDDALKQQPHFDKEISSSTTKPIGVPNKNRKIAKIIKKAQKFEGTKYKYGGTSKRGMDCSGLVFVAFTENNIPFPRTSRAMSLQGKRIYLKEVTKGDLLFFGTSKNRKVINHVGLVIEHSDEIYFIHATTSRGVIVSTLSERYWENNFVMARRFL
ncbi:C40 family peptidase [Zunongwangia sp.]|uniref:C40 family peptidase n=1 Tax=Zunongwangia sp. TaxID=1965325 RepID=UPI003AA9067B